MKSVLVTTSYYYDGKIESFTRAYLPPPPPVEQAEEWKARVGIQYDTGKEVHYTVEDVTPQSLRSSTMDRSELIVLCGRVCALDAVGAGVPEIPEGQTYSEWRATVDLPYPADLDLAREVVGEVSDGDISLFADSYLKNLFDESPCGDPGEAAKETLSEISDKGWNDGSDDADEVYQEQGAEALRYSQRADQLGWDEGAINAGVFKIVFRCSGTQEQRDTYYLAYDEGAKARAIELLAEAKEEENDQD